MKKYIIAGGLAAISMILAFASTDKLNLKKGNDVVSSVRVDDIEKSPTAATPTV